MHRRRETLVQRGFRTMRRIPPSSPVIFLFGACRRGALPHSLTRRPAENCEKNHDGLYHRTHTNRNRLRVL